MNNLTDAVFEPVTMVGLTGGVKDAAALSVLVLSDTAETTLLVQAEGPVSIRLVHSWIDVQKEITAQNYDVLALENPSETMLDGPHIAEMLRLQSDLHVAIFGDEIEVPLARLAMRKGVTGIMQVSQSAEPMDTPLRMVAEGKFYVDSALAGPLMDANTQASGLGEQPVISLADTVALVADDDEYFRMAVAQILVDQFGFADVKQASNLDQARQLLERSDRVDLALFDLSMPGMNGPSSLKDLRLEHPVIRKMAVVSASQDRNDVLESLSIGTYGFVSKAEGISELKLALGQMLKGRIYAPALLHELPEDFEDEMGPPSEPDAEAVVLSFDNSASFEQIPDPESVAEASRYVPETAADDLDGELEVIPDLSPRQRRVLELLVQGMSNKEIARELDLGIGTIKVHMTALFAKLGVSNRTSAVAVGARLL